MNQQELEGNLNYIDIAKQEGARLVWGGARLTDGAFAHGWFMEPAVLAGVKPSMRIAQDEIFGPVLSILAYDSEEIGRASCRERV